MRDTALTASLSWWRPPRTTPTARWPACACISTSAAVRWARRAAWLSCSSTSARSSSAYRPAPISRAGGEHDRYGVDDFCPEDETTVTVEAPYEQFGTIQKWLEDNGFEIVSGESLRVPTDTKEAGRRGARIDRRLVEKARRGRRRGERLPQHEGGRRRVAAALNRFYGPSSLRKDGFFTSKSDNGMKKLFRFALCAFALLAVLTLRAQSEAPNFPLPVRPDTLRILGVGNSFTPTTA